MGILAGLRVRSLPWGALLAVAALDPPSSRAFDRDSLPGYRIETWGTDQGLPSEAVAGIAQTPDGYLWVSTNAGLARFDGLRFTVFDHRNTPELGSDGCGSPFVDRDGALWTLTVGGGITRLVQGRFEAYGPEDGLAFEYGGLFLQDRKGKIWIGTSDRLHVWENGKFTIVGSGNGLPITRAQPVHEDEDGWMWLAGNEGYGAYREGVFREGVPVPEGVLRPARPWPGRDGTLWFTEPWALRVHRLRRGELTSFELDAAPADRVSRLLETSDGEAWIGLVDGGVRVIREGRQAALTEKEGLPKGAVTALVADREGNVWVGSQAGVSRVKRKTFAVLSARDGLPDDRTWAVYEDRRGDVWIGMEAGLARLHDGRVLTYGKRDGLPALGAVSIVEDRAGRIWLGTTAGLCRFDDGRFVTFTTKDGLSADNVRALFEDREGRLWIGTSTGGLNVLEDGRFRAFTTRDGLAGNWVRFILQAASGDLWVCTAGGVSRIHEGRITSFTVADGLPDDHVLTMHEDEDGALWFGTYRGGLCRLKDGRFRAIRASDGLPDDTILRILEDAQGNFWISTSRGVFRVSRASLDAFADGRTSVVPTVPYGKTDGLPTTDCGGGTQPAGWRTSDGRLWFPTSRGVAIVDPAAVRINTLVPEVVVEEVVHDGARTARADGAVLPPGTERVELHYTALSLTAPEKVRFRYRLEGFDSDWVEAGTKRVATYTHLPPGSYRFRVLAANNDGIWNETGASYALEARPRFYETRWFYAACLLLAAGALGAIHRLRLRQTEARYTAVLGERARIARELHDTIAQGFTGVSMHLEALSSRLDDSHAQAQARESLDRARLQIRASLADARRSVRDLRPLLLEPGDLAASLRSAATDLTAGTETGAVVNVIGKPARLSPEIEHHLFRVAQEAMTNAVRHGRARSLQILLAYQRRRVELLVEDDGCGFEGSPPRAVQGGGLGLLGMRERMERVGGRFEIASRPGRGTRVRASVPAERGLRSLLEARRLS